jgi:hypothetical protein
VGHPPNQPKDANVVLEVVHCRKRLLSPVLEGIIAHNAQGALNVSAAEQDWCMNIFVSHSAKDQRFLTLLLKLLEFHNIEYWCSQSHIKAGTRFESEIHKALSESEALLLLMSVHSRKSRWVFHELATFRQTKPEAHVLVLLLDEVDVTKLPGSIGQLAHVSFATSLLAGFEQLFEFFGLEFLSFRKVSPRMSHERRLNSPRQRLRHGFWRLITRLAA